MKQWERAFFPKEQVKGWLNMYAARIELGWVNKCFEGDSAVEIMREVESYQDFGCLLGMGRAQEGKKGQNTLKSHY